VTEELARALIQLRESRTQGLGRCGVIAVIRAPSPDALPLLGEALVAGGVTALEITTSTPEFARAIRSTKAHLGTAAMVGAGTILSRAQEDEALAAGAEFIVGPVLNPELVRPAHEVGVPVLLGAFTPTEAWAAKVAGSDFVKLFPAELLGFQFIEAMRAPLAGIRFVPTGGIDLGNIGAYRRAGSAAVGVGGSLLKAAWVKNGEWGAVTEQARAFRRAWDEAGT